MKNRTTMIVALALFALVVATVPAGAKPPEGKGKPGPSDDTTLGGTMCDPAGYPEDLMYLVDSKLIVGVPNRDFTFTLSGKQDGTCINVISIEGPWHVSITGEGARSLGIIPRDSIAPGDSCGGWILRKAIYDDERGGPLILGYDGSVPAATINACGTDFAEWVELEYLSKNDQDAYCYKDTKTTDKCLVTEQVNVMHPLVLQVFLSGSATGGVTTFVVDLP